MFGEQQRKNIQGQIRLLDENEDAELIPLRMIAAWEMVETMLRDVVEKDSSIDGSA
jgi:hypothetical protein